MADTDTVIRTALLERIQTKKARLDKGRPLPKDVLQRLYHEFRLAHTYNSDAIEGNTLSLQETQLILEDGITIGGRSIKEHLEALGNASAFDRIEVLAKGNKELDHVIIQEIHELVTKGQLMDSGRYRVHNVRITGANFTPPDFSKVIPLVDDLLEKIRKMKEHRIALASYLHYRFVWIHPFSDGNGRVARLLMNLYLMRYGYPPTVLKKQDRRKYYNYLNKANDGNLGPFVNFIAKAVDASLSLYISAFGGKDELVPLKELAQGSPYSQEYLSLRARQGILDAVKIGKTWHSTRSAMEAYLKRKKS
jgi:Fic family protein